MKKLLLSCFSVAMIFTLNTGLVHAEQEPDSPADTTESGEGTEQDTTPEITVESSTDEKADSSVENSTDPANMQEYTGGVKLRT